MSRNLTSTEASQATQAAQRRSGEPPASGGAAECPRSGPSPLESQAPTDPRLGAGPGPVYGPILTGYHDRNGPEATKLKLADRDHDSEELSESHLQRVRFALGT